MPNLCSKTDVHSSSGGLVIAVKPNDKEIFCTTLMSLLYNLANITFMQAA
jgi:hypothetical protein